MIVGGKSDRTLLLAFLIVFLAFAEAANETDAGVERDAELDFEIAGNRTNSTVDQPASNVPVSDEFVFCSLAWVGSGNGNVPHGAVVGGRTISGERLYIGRAYHNDNLLPGKIHPSDKCLYVPFGGREYKFSNYEVLVEVRHRFERIAEENTNGGL